MNKILTGRKGTYYSLAITALVPGVAETMGWLPAFHRTGHALAVVFCAQCGWPFQIDLPH